MMGIFSWFRTRELADEPTWLERLVMPRGRRDLRVEQIKRAAAADVAEMEAEDRKYFRQDGPGKIEDDL
jgi:hypothetical protein